MDDITNEIEFIKEGLTQLFSNDPIIWEKWLLVFISIILTVVVRIKFNIDEKFKLSKKLDEKVKKAIKNKHIINATLVSSHIGSEKNTCGGKYEYEINGKKYKYNAMFTGTEYPRRVLHLYYENNPRKVFTNEEYHCYGLKAVPITILQLSPLIVGAFMVWILGLAK